MESVFWGGLYKSVDRLEILCVEGLIDGVKVFSISDVSLVEVLLIGNVVFEMSLIEKSLR